MLPGIEAGLKIEAAMPGAEADFGAPDFRSRNVHPGPELRAGRWMPVARVDANQVFYWRKL